ncbi:MAG: two pore domain potassium channel family protein [Clostridia bacterium]|nr:two pore domain potassium channel family protein [Clostridia bacterium]
MLRDIFDYKGESRFKLLKLALNKYHIQTTLDTFNNKSQLDLFKDLIYHYFIHNSDIDLKKLAEFYFQNKDNYSYNSSEQGLLAIVLRWETDVGLALIEEIKKHRNIDGKQLNWSSNGLTYNLKKWHYLHKEILSYMLNQKFIYENLITIDSLIEDYLNLDFIPLHKLAANHFEELKNLSLDNASIQVSMFICPDLSNIVFHTLHIHNSLILGLDLQNATYAKNIILNNSRLFKGSLISPTDKQNNINLIFKKPNIFELLKSLAYAKKALLFQELELLPGTTLESKELYDYYNWYIYYVVNNRKRSKLTSFFDLVMSKYYTSFFYVFLWSVIFIVGYATAMYFLNHIGNFFTFKEGIKDDFPTYLFMSLTNFTTLGFGEIVPSHWFSYIVVTMEVFTGYYMLAMLVAIVAKREMKYS